MSRHVNTHINARRMLWENILAGHLRMWNSPPKCLPRMVTISSKCSCWLHCKDAAPAPTWRLCCTWNVKDLCLNTCLLTNVIFVSFYTHFSSADVHLWTIKHATELQLLVLVYNHHIPTPTYDSYLPTHVLNIWHLPKTALCSSSTWTCTCTTAGLRTVSQ